ncbi:MAG: hypothetical protein WAL75_15980 [Terracidiphilus sp.]
MRPNTPSPKQSAWLVIAMLAFVAIPAGITLHTVRVPATISIPGPDPTPHGYTFSLLLFLVPIAAIGLWLMPAEGVDIPKRAFWRTILILGPLGCALDFFFASRFFTFINKGATLGIDTPVVGGSVPIEEYVFYFSGFVAVLLMYLWFNEYWLSAYAVPDYASESRQIRRLLKFHPASLIAGIALIAVAVLYKKFLSQDPAGFPAYFTFLVLGAMVPSASLFDSARRLINWRAFSLTIFIMLLISMFWEATLAVPYGWWGFQQNQMMGLFIGAWAGLPVEEVFVWLAVTYATTIVFETVKICLASEKSVRESLLGTPAKG